MTAIDLLLVEDNPADAELAQEALRESSVRFEVHVVCDGERALDFLHRRGAYEAARRPRLVLLDLNLPKVKGAEILADIRASADLRELPVVVLTSSDNEAERRELYALGANCYLTKPLDHASFVTMIRRVIAYWFPVTR